MTAGRTATTPPPAAQTYRAAAGVRIGTETGDRIEVGAVAQEVLALHLERTGRPAPPERNIAVRHWIPAGARKTRRRLFVRVDVGGVPVGVAKVPLAAQDPKLTHEFTVLTGLPAAFPLARPGPLGRLGAGFAMTYLDGVDLPAVGQLTAGPEEFWHVMRPVVDGVAALHLTTAAGAPHLTPEQAAAQYVRRPWTGAEHTDNALRRALLAPTHGDLGPWNVRYEPGRGTVRLLDFEDYKPLGIAAVDVLNLLVTSGLLVFPDYREHGFDWLYDRVFESDHWFCGALARGLAHYAAATGQRTADVADLTPLMCQWLIERITAEGRDTSGMFYRTFADRYLSGRPAWVRSADA